MTRSLTLLGATGSIGASTLDLVRRNRDAWQVEALTAQCSAAELAAQMEAAEGWTVAQRSLEQEPDSETEVYIPDSAAEYGLWYRLAPVSYMGGSLLGEGCARNPMEPAALGSAIVYGPRPGDYGTVFGRLGAAQAARAVGSASDLGEALSDLLAPDRAARAGRGCVGCFPAHPSRACAGP